MRRVLGFFILIAWIAGVPVLSSADEAPAKPAGKEVRGFSVPVSVRLPSGWTAERAAGGDRYREVFRCRSGESRMTVVFIGDTMFTNTDLETKASRLAAQLVEDLRKTHDSVRLGDLSKQPLKELQRGYRIDLAIEVDGEVRNFVAVGRGDTTDTEIVLRAPADTAAKTPLVAMLAAAQFPEPPPAPEAAGRKKGRVFYHKSPLSLLRFPISVCALLAGMAFGAWLGSPTYKKAGAGCGGCIFLILLVLVLGVLEMILGAPILGGLGGAAYEAGTVLPHAVISGVCFIFGVLSPTPPPAPEEIAKEPPERRRAHKVQARLIKEPPTDV